MPELIYISHTYKIKNTNLVEIQKRMSRNQVDNILKKLEFTIESVIDIGTITTWYNPDYKDDTKFDVVFFDEQGYVIEVKHSRKPQ